MDFEYERLLEKIRERCGTHEAFARKLGMGRVSLSKRLNNRLRFSQEEIRRACELLDIGREQIPAYFFTEKV